MKQLRFWNGSDHVKRLESWDDFDPEIAQVTKPLRPWNASDHDKAQIMKQLR